MLMFMEKLFLLIIVAIFTPNITHSQVNPDDTIEEAIITLSLQQSILNQTVQSNKIGITNLQNNVNAIIMILNNIENQVIDLMQNIQDLNTTCQRLNNVNKIWSKNFKIVNNTFNQLRKKITFKINSPPLIFYNKI